jgi:hypothetical protein
MFLPRDTLYTCSGSLREVDFEIGRDFELDAFFEDGGEDFDEDPLAGLTVIEHLHITATGTVCQFPIYNK